MCWTMADLLALDDYINLSLAIACRGCQGMLERGHGESGGQMSLVGVLIPVMRRGGRCRTLPLGT